MSKTIRKLAHSKTFAVIALLLVFALFWVRMIHLDQDLPPWGVACYQPKDEGCYAILAINEMEYGQINPNSPIGGEENQPMYIQEHVRVNYLGNLLESVSLRLFGDNYLGLRSPMVWIGFANLLLMAAILFWLRSHYGKKNAGELWGIAGVLLLVSLHFQFYVSSRTVEPSTLRMLFLQLTILIWLVLNRHRAVCFFLMGACVCASVFLVYLTNMFLFLAGGLLLLFIWKQEGFRRFLTGAVGAAIGALAVFVVAELYYRKYWGCSSISNLLGTFSIFSGLEGYTISTSIFGLIRGAVKSVAKYFSGLWFLYAPSCLFLALLAWPTAFKRSWKEKDASLFFIAIIPIAFLMQTMVSEDYIWRKLIVAAPCFVFLSFWFLLKREEIFGEWNELSDFWRNRKRKIIPWCWMVLSALLVCAMTLFHLKISNDLGKLDFSKLDKLVLLIAPLCVLAWCFVFLWFRRKGTRVSMKISVLLLGLSVLVPNLTVLTEYVWTAPKYSERDMMISLSEKYDLDGKYVTGDYVMGITLYNDLKPIYDDYSNYGTRLAANEDLVLHHYATDSLGFKQYINSALFSPYSDYAAKEIEIIPSGFQAYGLVRDFALYKAVPKEELIREELDSILQIQQQMREIESANEGLDSDSLIQMRQDLENEISQVYITYSDCYDDYRGDVLSTMYVDIYGDVYGDIYATIHGRIFGTVYGDINAEVDGDIFGDVYGDIRVPIKGKVHGKVYGSVPDSVVVLNERETTGVSKN